MSTWCLKQMAWWAELMQNPKNRYHGFEGTAYFWRNEDGEVDPMGAHTGSQRLR